MSSLPTQMLRLSEIDLGDEEIRRVVEVLESRWLSMGPATEEFEAAFAGFTGARHAIAVTNATAALHLAHHALGVGPGDEVIMPALTFVATANSVLYTGATPVFADIVGDDDLNVDPSDIERKITPRTKGIVVVHYGGHPVAMDAVTEMARAHGLYVVEDASHAPGGTYHGRALGTIGEVGCYSFYSNKNMTTGEGGMVVTNDDALAARIRKARSHGMTTLTWDRMRGHAHTYDVVDLGFNYRIDELRAALGIIQLNRLRANNERRRALMEKYLTALRFCRTIHVPFDGLSGESAYHLCPILLEDGSMRAPVMDRMRERGIQTSIHYPPIHLFSYYRERFGYQEGLLPRTESVTNREVTLPLSPQMHDDDVLRVTTELIETLESLTAHEGR